MLSGAILIRTQVQLTESQMRQLKELARRRKVPIAALIREGTDLVLRDGMAVSDDEKRNRAMQAAGKFHAQQRDLAEGHDRYLAEAMGQ